MNGLLPLKGVGFRELRVPDRVLEWSWARSNCREAAKNSPRSKEFKDLVFGSGGLGKFHPRRISGVASDAVAWDGKKDGSRVRQVAVFKFVLRPFGFSPQHFGDNWNSRIGSREASPAYSGRASRASSPTSS